ncbi:MAG TPA: flagellar basal-body rod protein FlgF [Thermotogota bacterium]|nr:flagellar basal-body rod protein FlgF [Thermotogota bacterium]HPJ88869.1 flagellar basal-body rod protein FlgF [Thermotogota bacterium]HPR96153.1 flagellar basal-body rod protein FlgF [Thermotogota bacterium]
MIRGIYTAAMGMLAEESKVNNISNNLANVDTAGFKKDGLAFSTYLKKEIFRNESEDHFNKRTNVGKMESGVVLDESKPWFEQGAIEMTGSEYDFAITGEGFFTVETADGRTYYTRNGQWHRDNENFLVDSVGNYVLNDAGERITIEEGFRVDQDGSIYENGVLTGRIDLVTFDNPDGLRKVGNNYFAATDYSGPSQQNFDATVVQGGFERANVNAVKEMVNLINAQRHFEIAQRVITTEDQLLDAAVNRVGKV